MTTGTSDRTAGRIGGIAFKAPVKAASTANLTLSGEQTVDGVALVTGDYCLVKNQTTTANNGLYLVDTGSWTRRQDMDGAYDVAKGTLVYVNSGGSTNGNTFWALTSSDPITIGTSAITYTQVLVPSDVTISYTSARTGSVSRTLRSRIDDIISVKNFGATCDGSTDDTAAFQLAATSVTTGVVEILVPATAKVTGTVTAGTGVVAWRFARGATLTGGGTLPFHKQSMNYNVTPNYATRDSIWHGTTANPTQDGTVPTQYIQRVDSSVTADTSSNLIAAQYITLRRLSTGTGWLYGSIVYVEDDSSSGSAETVAVAGVAHATNAAHTSGAGTQVWGLYSEAHAHYSFHTATGAEHDAVNDTGTDYGYNTANPVGVAHTKALWLLGTGGKKNSFGMGIGSAELIAGSFGAGIFFQKYSCNLYGIDIQAQPPTIINFGLGASTDGSGGTPGGIGLDCGASASYGSAAHYGAIHLRDHRFVMGTAGLAYQHYHTANGYFEFVYNGKLQGVVNAAAVTDDTVYRPILNGDPVPRTITAATDAPAITDVNLICNRAGTVTLTLPDPTKCAGRVIRVKTLTANAVESATAIVQAQTSTAATTSMLAATAGKWGQYQANGNLWVPLAYN